MPPLFYQPLNLLLLFSLKQHTILAMLGRREHVYWDGAAGFVAVFGEVFEISCESCRVAGDVDDLFGMQGEHGREELLVTSASRANEAGDQR